MDISNHLGISDSIVDISKPVRYIFNTCGDISEGEKNTLSEIVL